MIFVPMLAATAVKVTVAEMIGIGATVFGIGAGIKGAIDYSKAKKLKAEAEAEYQQMAHRIRQRTAKLKKNSERLAA